MRYCNVYGESSTARNIEILNMLRKVVPQVKWELCWADSKVGLDEVGISSYIGVPEFELDQASYIIDMLEQGIDFSEDSDKQRYPELIGIDNNALPSITSFAQSVKNFIDFLGSQPHDDIKKYLQDLLLHMSTLYSNYFHLPDIPDVKYYDSCFSSININLPAKLIPFLEFCEFEGPFEGITNIRNVEEILHDIVVSLGGGVSALLYIS